MNIAKAFVERNRLKKFITEKSYFLQVTQVGHPKEEGERSWVETDNVDLDTLLEVVLSAKDALTKFNIAIDAANAKGGRKILDELEGLKAQQSTLKNLYDKIRQFKAKELVQLDGQAVLVERVLDVDKDLVKKRLNDVTKDIQAKEDELAAFNASTIVELDDELAKYLKEYKS